MNCTSPVETSIDADARPEYQIRVSDSPDEPEWDAFLEKTAGGHHTQASLWSKAKMRKDMRVIRILAIRNERIIAGVQMLIRPLSFLGAAGYISKGPIFAVEDPVLGTLMMDELHRVARSQRVLYLSLQPPGHHSDVPKHLLEAGFRLSPLKIAQTATVQLDLTPSLEEIEAGLKKKIRRYLRYGKKHGLVGRVGTERDLPAFYRLLQETGRRQGFDTFDEAYFDEMWQLLHPKGYMQVFLVEYEGEAISGQVVIAFGDTVVCKHGGWSGAQGKLGPNYLMDWITIEWAKSQGFRCYDFEGIQHELAEGISNGTLKPDPTNCGATYYKLGFGGKVVFLQDNVDYVYNPLLRFGYTKIFPKLQGRPFVKKLLKRLRA